MRKILMACGAAAAVFGVAYAVQAHDDPSHNQLTPDIVATTTVELSGLDRITIQIGEAPTLVIEERRGRLKGVTIKSSAERLSVDADTGGWFSGRDYTATLTLPALEDLSLSGSFDADVSGVSSDRVEVDVAGSGDLVISGRCETLSLESAGAMDIDASALICQHVRIDSAGAADIDVYAAASLDVETAGANDVTYGGNPAKVTSDVAGMGSVKATPAEKADTSL